MYFALFFSHPPFPLGAILMGIALLPPNAPYRKNYHGNALSKETKGARERGKRKENTKQYMPALFQLHVFDAKELARGSEKEHFPNTRKWETILLPPFTATLKIKRGGYS